MLEVGAIIHLLQGVDPVVGLFSNQIIRQHIAHLNSPIYFLQCACSTSELTFNLMNNHSNGNTYQQTTALSHFLVISEDDLALQPQTAEDGDGSRCVS
jgi:hypothetical protein